MLAAIVLGLFFTNAIFASQVDYTGYKVIKFDIQNEEQLNFLAPFQTNSKFITEDHAMVVGLSTTMAIPPTQVEYVTRRAARIGTHMEVIYEDMQTIIDLEKASANKGNNLNFDFDAYHTYEDIVTQMEIWWGECPAGLTCDLYSFATSYEGRELWTLKIGNPEGSANAYWLHGVTHAREWLGTATLLKIMDHFWTGYGSDSEVTELLDNYDWYLTPVANPDGYSYSWTNDRMQRKNRSPNEASDCLGTDLNRNYDSSWGTEGVSHNPCDGEIYCGDFAASELETIGVQNEISRIASGQNLLAFVDIHCYGKMILMPYSTSEDGNGRVCERAPNHEELTQISNAFADAIQETHGTSWKRGSPCDILYTVSGGSMDWGIEKGGCKYAFAPELRGLFFTANPDQIQPSFEEFFNGVKAMVAEIALLEGIETM